MGMWNEGGEKVGVNGVKVGVVEWGGVVEWRCGGEGKRCLNSSALSSTPSAPHPLLREE